MRYINPLTDFGFKRLFGSEPHKDLLIAFLNSILDGRKQILDLEYDMQERQGEIEEEGLAIFDLVCRGPQGERFIIEIQKGAAPNFVKRSLFYVSRLISGMAPSGKRKAWNYAIDEVYFVALIESAPMSIKGEETDYLHKVSLCSEKSGQVIFHGLCLVYIELRNFAKQEEELITDQDRWFYALKHLSDLDKLPMVLSKPVFERLFKIAEYTNLSKEEKKMYDISQKRRWDKEYLIEGAKHEGRELGRAEGHIEGRAEGRQEGIEIGIEKGTEETKRATAKKMKAAGISIDIIQSITELSAKEIDSL